MNALVAFATLFKNSTQMQALCLALCSYWFLASSAAQADTTDLRSEQVQQLLAVWPSLLESFPLEQPTVPGQASPLQLRAIELLNEEQTEEAQAAAARGIDLKKILDEFSDKLTAWIKTYSGARDELVAKLLLSFYSQGYADAETEFQKQLRAVSSSSGKRTIVVSPDLFFLKTHLAPARFFLADELSLWLQAGPVPLTANDVTKALQQALLRRVMLDLRLARLRAAFENPALTALVSSEQFAKLNADYRALLAPVSNPTLGDLEHAKIAPSLATLSKVLELERHLNQASVALERAVTQIGLIHPEIQVLVQKAQQLAQTQRELASSVFDFPREAAGPFVRARLTRETEDGYPGSVQAEFFIVRPSAVTVSMSSKRKPSSAERGATEPRSATATAQEEIPLGLRVSHLAVENGQLLAKPTIKFTTAVDIDVLRTALERLGMPAWLLHTLSATYEPSGQIVLVVTGMEPDLGLFGLAAQPLPPVTINLDLSSSTLSLESQLLAVLKSAGSRGLDQLWQRVLAYLQQFQFDGLQLQEVPRVSIDAPWPHTLRFVRDNTCVFQFDVGLSTSSPSPRLTISNFQAQELLRTYFHAHVLPALRETLHWEPEIEQFATIALGEFTEDGPGLTLGGTVAISFRTLQLQVPEPPPLRFRFRPFQKTGQWEIAVPAWQAWYQVQRKALAEILATAAQRAIADGIHGLEGKEWRLGPVKVKILTPITYVPADKCYQADSQWQIGPDAEAVFKIVNVRVRGGYDAASQSWVHPDLDLSAARAEDTAALERAVRALLNLPATLGNDRLHLAGLRFDRGGLALRLHLDFRELGIEFETGEIAISPSGVQTDVRRSLLTALEVALRAHLQRNDLSIPGIGPVRSIALDPERTHFDGKPQIAVRATMRLMTKDIDIPMVVFPDFEVDTKGLEQALTNEVGQLVSGELRISLPGLEVTPKKPAFLLGPPRLQVVVKLSIPFLQIELDPVTITQHGLELPERLSLGLREFGAVLEKSVRTATDSIIVLSDSTAVFYPRQGGRLDIMGNLTVGDGQIGHLLKVASTLQTDLRRFSALHLKLTGDLLILDRLQLFTLDGDLDLGKLALDSRAKAVGPIANILDPSLHSVLNFKDRIFTDEVGLRILRMNLVKTRFEIHAQQGIEVTGSADADLLIGNMKAGVTAGVANGRLRWSVDGGVDVNIIGLNVAGAHVWINERRAKIRASAFGFPLTASVPSVEELTPALLLDLISSLFHWDPELLKNLFSGHIEISPGGGNSPDGENDKNKGRDDGGSHSPLSISEKAGSDGPFPQRSQDKPAPRLANEIANAPDKEARGGKLGPHEDGVAVWSSEGVNRLADIEKADWLIERVEDGKPLYTWRKIGAAWRIAIIGNDAFLCPFYFDEASAKADTAPPRRLLANAQKFVPKHGEAPSPLCHALFEELLSMSLVGGTGHFTGRSEADGANAVNLAAGLANQPALEVFRVAYPPLVGGEFDRAPVGAPADPFAHSAIVLKDPAHQVFLVHFPGVASVEKFSVATEDPLLTNKFLPSTEDEGALPEVARFVGQYAWLQQRGTWDIILADRPGAYFLSASEIAVLQLTERAVPSLHLLHRPKETAPSNHFDPTAWQPIVRILEDLSAAGGLGEKDELFVNSMRPTELLILKPGATDWGLRYFSRPGTLPPPQPFTGEHGRPLPEPFQELGNALLASVQHARLRNGAPMRFIAACPSGNHPQGNETSTEFDPCSADMDHWAVRFQFWMQDGVRHFAWLDIHGQSLAALSADQITAELMNRARSDALEELRPEVEGLLRALKSHRAGGDHLAQLAKSLPAPQSTWPQMQLVTGSTIIARYADWVGQRKAIADKATPLDLTKPENQRQLATWFFAPAQEWSQHLLAHPRGLIFGE